MRTTIELSEDLFRRAKASAAARGESLKTLVTRAIATEVAYRRPAKPLIRFPIGDPNGPKLKLTNEDIERILTEEDILRVTGGHPRKRR